jgi:predicted nucleotide-binding protein
LGDDRAEEPRRDGADSIIPDKGSKRALAQWQKKCDQAGEVCHRAAIQQDPRGLLKMNSYEELFAIADRLEAVRASGELAAAEKDLVALDSIAADADRAFSGSWLGYHSYVYYENLGLPPPGAHFSQEWGLKDMSITDLGTRGEWREYDPKQIETFLRDKAGDPDLKPVHTAAAHAEIVFNTAKADILSILLIDDPTKSDTFLTKLTADLDRLQPLNVADIVEIWSPKGEVMTRDSIALGQRSKTPPHMLIRAEVATIRQAFNICDEASKIARKAASHLERKAKRNVRESRIGTNVFLGHGRSPAWRVLKDFVQDRLHLPWDEFNRVPVAGVTNQARLAEMLEAAAVALVIMTAEDETAEGQMQARMNVIHEVGLFQGRLGFTKAIVLVEEGCQEFTNIQGLGQIRFPAGNISACFEEVRRVLEREAVIAT